MLKNKLFLGFLFLHSLNSVVSVVDWFHAVASYAVQQIIRCDLFGKSKIFMCFRVFPSGTLLWKTSLVSNYFHRITQFIVISLKIVKVRVLKLLLNFKHSGVFMSVHKNLKSQSKQFVCMKNNYTFVPLWVDGTFLTIPWQL